MNVIGHSLNWVLSIMQILLIVRALLSWLPQSSDSKLSQILYQLTEPLILPVRRIVERTRFADLPIDISFLIVFLILEIAMQMISSYI